jgi:hypothetical protein
MHLIAREFERELTPETFLALWLAIHGGDPAHEPINVLTGGLAVLSSFQEGKGHVEAGAEKLEGEVVQAMNGALSTFAARAGQLVS